MKKLVVLILASLFVANVAMAVVDPDTNSMGFYFDLTADNYELSLAAPGSFPAYIILTNPDFDAVYGYEFGFEVVGNMMVMNVINNGTGPIDVGGGVGNHIVGLASPLAATPATLIATVNIFAMDTGSIAMTLKGATPNSVPGSVTPAVLLAGDVIMAAGLSAGIGEDGLPNVCATVNDPGRVVATDEVSIDAVKALYR